MSSHHLPDGVRRWLLAGRWLLLAEAVGGTAFLVSARGLRGIAVAALVGLCVYGAVSLVIVTRRPLERVPITVLLSLDLIGVGVAASVTGGPHSPLVSQFFIVIFVASVVRGLWGGLAAGGVAAGICALLALAVPDGRYSPLPQLVLSLLVAGGATGYLAQGMQTGARRLAESLLREKQQELEGRLAERERAVDAKIVQREMDLARAMQMAALPDAIPDLPGLEIAARAELAQEVGGDFYMFIQDGNRTDIVLGDVSGKGIQAAFTATSVAYLLPWLEPLRDPLTALCNLNTDLIQHLPEASFVTLVMAEVDAVAGTLHVWNAGHPPALLWRAAASHVEEGTSKGPLLGILPAWEGEPQTWSFETGDVLLLYSDGLSEARNAERAMFDLRIRGVLVENSAGTAAEILEALFREVRAWGEPADDLTVLACRRTRPQDGGDAPASKRGTAHCSTRHN